MNVLTIDFEHPQAGEQLVTSLHETGFAVLRNHSIEKHLMDDIYRDWQAFFDSDEKYQYAHSSSSETDIQDGFYPLEISEKAVGASHKDIKEFYHVVPDGQIPAHLEQNIFAYRNQAMAMGSELLRWVQEHSPRSVTDLFSEPVAEVLSDTATLLRILHYPKLAQELPENLSAKLRAAPHEDINFLTILPVAREPGLQVKSKDGAWLDLQGFEGDLIINNGDMLQEASGGYFPSTTHRVVNPSAADSNVSRISMPFFLTPYLQFVLSDRYTAGSYLQERLDLIAGAHGDD